MKRSVNPLVLLLFVALCIQASASGQAPVVVRDTARPPLLPVYNAGFDVIIKTNGDILYGLVQEVGLQLIKYQRTDIPNGPVYTIPRYEVYAISYRNQVKEIMTDIPDPTLIQRPGYNGYYDNRLNRLTRPTLFRDGIVRFGLGLIRTSSRVANAGNYSSGATFPVVSLAYDVNYRNKARLGLMLAIGSHKFSGQDYSAYDSTQSDVSIKENTFSIYAYGRYYFLASSTSALKPYVTIGVGIVTSNIKSNYNISFINNPGKVVQVQSGSRAGGLGLLGRLGADYYFNPRLSAFGDIGAGPSLLNFGVSAGIN